MIVFSKIIGNPLTLDVSKTCKITPNFEKSFKDFKKFAIQKVLASHPQKLESQWQFCAAVKPKRLCSTKNSMGSGTSGGAQAGNYDKLWKFWAQTLPFNKHNSLFVCLSLRLRTYHVCIQYTVGTFNIVQDRRWFPHMKQLQMYPMKNITQGQTPHGVDESVTRPISNTNIVNIIML